MAYHKTFIEVETIKDKEKKEYKVITYEYDDIEGNPVTGKEEFKTEALEAKIDHLNDQITKIQEEINYYEQAQ